MSRGPPAAWRAARLAAGNLLILLALLLPLELVFGTWLHGDSGIDLFNVRPNTLYVEASPLYPAGRTITYSRDRYAFRAGTGEASRIDVLAIGGSTTNDRYLDDADIWTVRLQRRLAEQGCPVGIANAGIDGFSTVGHIASFSRWFNRVPGLRPRVVLAYIGVNDAVLEPSAVPVEQRDPGWRLRVETYIGQHSALYRLYVTLRGWWRARKAGVLHGELPSPPDAVWENVALPADFAALAARRSDAYRERLQRLDVAIRSFGAMPVYITQERADGRRVVGGWQQVRGSRGAVEAAALQVIDGTTLTFCRDTGALCIDLAGRLRFAPGDFYDAVHTTIAGSARIGDFLAPELAPILCPPPRS